MVQLRPIEGVRRLALAAALLCSASALAQELPGARPGSTVRIMIPRRDVLPVPAEVPRIEAPKVESAAVVPPKPLEAKPVESKPLESNPPESKPLESKPGEQASAVVAPPGEVDEAKIRAFLEPLKTKYRLKPDEVAGFVAAYAARGGKPYFIEDNNGAITLSPKVEAIARTLAGAGADGLDPARLMATLPATRSGMVPGDKRIETELAAAFAAYLYARDARGGRLEPSRLSGLITPTLYFPAPSEVLERLSAAAPQAVAGVLEGYQPQHAGYRSLKDALAKLNEPVTPVITGNVAGAPGAPDPLGTLPKDFLAGGAFKLGQADPRVPNLRVRLNLPASASNIFDAELREALITFQRANGLTANGVLTPRTRQALENPASPVSLAAARSDKRALRTALLVNMERWRWLPPELGERHVFVNIPAFELKLMDKGAALHTARVIVGKPETQTPVFSDTFAHVIVNPSWFVPPSIMKKEFLPRLASDPSYAARRGFEVVRTRNGISVRQPPGERNALGHVKFIFPNRHSVYLHDTPSRGLFASETRAFSHGCVRVDKPFALAEKLLSQSGGFSEGQLKGMVGRGERMIKMADKVGVHLAYFTLEADEGGALHHHRDLYGHDSRVRQALAL